MTNSSSYIITLTPYERDNLYALMLAVGTFAGTDVPISPFSTANNGDWVAQVCSKLQPGPGRPNFTAVQLADRANEQYVRRSMPDIPPPNPLLQVTVDDSPAVPLN